DLAGRGARESLRRRITFAPSDWADVPLGSGGVDAVFATNALPRESAAGRLRGLEEGGRGVRPGGLVLIAPHHFIDSDVEPILRGAGWMEARVLGGERPAQPGATGFQVRYSSG